MYVKPCPKCGRTPKINDCISNKERVRVIYCPNFCSLPHCFDNRRSEKMISTFMLRYVGDGDDNSIFKVWNDVVADK